MVRLPVGSGSLNSAAPASMHAHRSRSAAAELLVLPAASLQPSLLEVEADGDQAGSRFCACHGVAAGFISVRELTRWLRCPSLLLYSRALAPQTTSKRIADIKSARFQKNVLKRGNVPESSSKKQDKLPVSTYVIAFFVFVIIGSCKGSSFARLSRPATPSWL